MAETPGPIRSFGARFPFASDGCGTDSAVPIRVPSGPLADTK
jgi:hypothetical protein